MGYRGSFHYSSSKKKQEGFSLTDGGDDDGSSWDTICNDVDETVVAATNVAGLRQSRPDQSKSAVVKRSRSSSYQNKICERQYYYAEAKA